jgi:gliding motility-associated-like protein
VSNNTCQAADSVTITVFNPPNIFIVPGNPAICEGGSVVLTAGGAATYTWQPAAGLSSTTGASVMAFPASTTIYSITGTDLQGCSDTLSFTLTVHTLPVLEVTADASVICRGASASLEASGAATYAWSPSAGLSQVTGPNVIASPGQTTLYEVQGTSAQGCTSYTTFLLTVIPPPVVDLGPDRFFCTGDPLVLDAGWNPYVTGYEWQDGSNRQTYAVTDAGYYAVTVTNEACEVMDDVTLSACTELWIPNAFIPNNNGSNEYFEVKASTMLTSYQISIFNRWGQMVFESYDINDPWDGNTNGEPCPIGVYTYVIYYRGYGNLEYEKENRRTGIVTLLR